MAAIVPVNSELNADHADACCWCVVPLPQAAFKEGIARLDESSKDLEASLSGLRRCSVATHSLSHSGDWNSSWFLFLKCSEFMLNFIGIIGVPSWFSRLNCQMQCDHDRPHSQEATFQRKAQEIVLENRSTAQVRGIQMQHSLDRCFGNEATSPMRINLLWLSSLDAFQVFVCQSPQSDRITIFGCF